MGGEDPSPRRAVWWALGTLVLAALCGAVWLSGTHPSVAESRDAEPAFLGLEDGGTLWPYTSRTQSFEGRTLAMSVVVRASPGETRRLLVSETPADWEPADPAVDPDADVVDRWTDTTGAVRYAYVESGEDGQWLTERYQLDDGTYLGAREHVRAYGTDDGGWTALQVHGEHWDWFRLRHTVDDVAVVRTHLLGDLTRSGEAALEQSRGSTAIVVTAAAGLLVAGRLRRRLPSREFAAISLATGGVYLAVRLVGIAIESAVPALHPKAVAAPLYPCVAIGIPALAYLAAARLARERRGRAIAVFGFAAGGLAIALLADAVLMGATAVSGRVLLHRAAVVLSAGLVAAAGTPDGPSLAPGVTLWAITLLLPLAAVV